tara:strand:- start:841 stop:1038 length:198 start_codon:yes stop_codon:yes gene_type:complete
MKRYEYKFTTHKEYLNNKALLPINNNVEIITVKGKGIKGAIKEFKAAFLTVEYLNKNNKLVIKKG